MTENFNWKNIQSYDIDILRKIDDKVHIYELKPYENVKSIIREALGQILEYVYFNDWEQSIEKIIIIGKVSMDDSEKRYWDKLKTLLHCPLEYHVWDGKKINEQNS